MTEPTDHDGPHGPDCACHRSTDEIRDEFVTELEDADVFAGATITMTDEGPEVSMVRGYDEDLPFGEMVAMQEMLDSELDELINDGELHPFIQLMLENGMLDDMESMDTESFDFDEMDGVEVPFDSNE